MVVLVFSVETLRLPPSSLGAVHQVLRHLWSLGTCCCFATVFPLEGIISPMGVVQFSGFFEIFFLYLYNCGRPCSIEGGIVGFVAGREQRKGDYALFYPTKDVMPRDGGLHSWFSVYPKYG